MSLHPILAALGWALLHFLWQGALLALLLVAFNAAAGKAASKVDARLRYAAGCAVMLAMAAVFAWTVFRHYRAVTPVIPNALTAQVPLSPAPLRSVKGAASATTPLLRTAAPAMGPPDWIGGLWLLGVAALSLYTALGLVRAAMLKRRGTELVHSAWVEALRDLQCRLRVSTPVRLCGSALAEAPAVIGWLRPYILLPVTALTGLSESQLRAILAHELAHIRRHDYLVNLLQTAVETLLFFHPAVWWVSRQIRQERENCCDDIAVAICGDAVEYAGALAGMEEIRARVPELALAATGGELLARIRRLLGEPEQASRSIGRIAATALALAIAGVPALLSQQRPAFEVATVKLNSSGDASFYFRMAGVTPSITNQTLRNIIKWGYNVQDFQLTGGPAWTGTDRWDVEAKTTAGASIDQRRLMVQSLLEDRFKLAVHREVKELPIFNLTVVKGGLKIQPIKAGDCIAHDPGKPSQPPPGKTFMDMCNTAGFGRGSLIASSATMTELAQMLSNAVGRTVVDKTGISGQFRINMKFAAEGTSTAQDGGPPPPADVDAPSIYTALQEQLGLRLDSSKGPVEVLVIDRAEKPSEN